MGLFTVIISWLKYPNLTPDLFYYYHYNIPWVFTQMDVVCELLFLLSMYVNSIQMEVIVEVDLTEIHLRVMNFW